MVPDRRRPGNRRRRAEAPGALLVFVGGYDFLRNDMGLNLGELDGDLVWPVAVILGCLLLARGLRSPQHPRLSAPETTS
jgi:hypothetical protein